MDYTVESLKRFVAQLSTVGLDARNITFSAYDSMRNIRYEYEGDGVTRVTMPDGDKVQYDDHCGLTMDQRIQEHDRIKRMREKAQKLASVLGLGIPQYVENMSKPEQTMLSHVWKRHNPDRNLRFFGNYDDNNAFTGYIDIQ